MGANHIGLNGFGGPFHHQLDAHRRCQMDNGVSLAGQTIQHKIVAQRLDSKRKSWIGDEVRNVAIGPRAEIIQDRDTIPALQQSFGQMTADKARPPCDQYLHSVHLLMVHLWLSRVGSLYRALSG